MKYSMVSRSPTARWLRRLLCLTVISQTVSFRIRQSTWLMKHVHPIKTELDSMPTELDELNRKIMQLEIEEAALKKEDDRLSQERLAETAGRTGRSYGKSSQSRKHSGITKNILLNMYRRSVSRLNS